MALDIIKIPFEHDDLAVAVGSYSALIRSKVRQAISRKVSKFLEADSMESLLVQIREHRPAIIIVGFKLFMDDDFPGPISSMSAKQRPEIILTASQAELDGELPSKGVAAVLPLPFIPEMVLLKINTVLQPRRSWRKETEMVLRQMRKFQRFPVEDVTVHLHKPINEKTTVVDISYQGIKIKTSEIYEDQLGAEFRMQVNCEGSYLIINGKLMWLSNGQAGIRFIGSRPGSFNRFFNNIMAHAFLTGQ